MLVTRLSSLAPMSGASFSKAPETFRARKTISVSQYLKQRCVSVLPCQWVGDTDLTLMLSILSLFLVTAAAAAHDVSPSSAPLLSTVLLLFPPHVGFGLVPYLNALIRMNVSFRLSPTFLILLSIRMMQSSRPRDTAGC